MPSSFSLACALEFSTLTIKLKTRLTNLMTDINTEKQIDHDYIERSKRLDLASKEKILHVLEDAILLDVRGPGEIEDKVLQFPFVHIPVTPKDTAKLTKFAPKLLPNKDSASKFHTFSAIGQFN